MVGDEECSRSWIRSIQAVDFGNVRGGELLIDIQALEVFLGGRPGEFGLGGSLLGGQFLLTSEGILCTNAEGDPASCRAEEIEALVSRSPRVARHSEHRHG